MKTKILSFLFLLFGSGMFAQLPTNVLVGYHENWNTLKLSQINSNYNVICLAFALPVNYPSVGYDIRYTIPAGYTGTAAQMKTAFMADIDALHAQGKTVLLSLGGATGPIRLDNTTQRDVFVSSVNTILADYSYKIDGIDLDLETTSMAFGSTWTMSSPAAGQTNMVNAVKSIMSNYLTQTGKKMILTAAPEVIYLMGALSSWQVTNANGGAFLPILDGLRNDIDLLHMQLYNAGGSSGGVYAWNNTIYYDDGTIAFPLAMNESVIKGFTLLSGKGTFTGLPASKLAFGLPATNAANAASTGYITPTNVCNAARYFKGEITKPAGCTYTMSATYPTLKGLMTWSINEDSYASYPFAGAYTCAFPTNTAPVANFTVSSSTVCVGQTVTFTDASTNTPTSWSWNFGSGASTATSTAKGPHNITYSTTGTKTISLTATNGGGSNSTSQNITVVAASGNAGAITGNASVCQTSSQTYSISAVTGATTYTWSVPTGSTITSGQGTTSITVTIGGTAGNITVTPSNSCSTGTAASKAITISPAPNAAGSITGSNSVCANATNVNYSISSVTNATGYTWTVPTGATIVSGQGTTAIVVNMGTTSGNVAVTPTNTCGNGTAATLAVTVNTAPGAAGSITGNATACANQTGITYSIAAVSGATNYTWTVPSGASITAGQGTTSITMTMGSTAGNVGVTPSNTCGNGTAATKAISIVTSTVAGAITGTTSVCQGSSQTYSISAVSGATNYAWTVPTGSSITAGQGTTSITVTIGATAGNVVVTPSNGCGNGTPASLGITVNPLPSAAASITGNTSTCANTTALTYSISAVGNATGYTWTVPSGATITAGQGTTSITVTMGSTSGNVSVTPTNSCGNGTASSLAVTVNSGPSAAGSITGSTSVCSGQTLTYSISAVSGATNYTWTVPSGSSIVSGQGTTSISVLIGSSAGNITVTPSNTCGNGSAATLAVSPLGATTPIVEGFETTVPPTPWQLVNGDASTTWSSTNTAFSSGTKSAKMTFFGYTSLGQRDELQTMSVSFAGLSSSALTFKHAYAWMDRPGSNNDRFDSLEVMISIDCGSTWTSLWKKGGSTLSTLTSGAGQSTAFTPTSGQWVLNTISLAAYDNVGSVKIKFVACNRNGNNLYLDDINISGTVAVAPVANFTSDKTTVCAGGTVTFTNSSTNAPTSYSWNFGTGASPATATGVGPHTVTYATAGTATVALTVSNTAGSNTNTKTNLITVNPLPSAAGSISGGASVCGGATGNVYSISSVANATGYTWTVPTGSTITAGQGTTSITVTFGSTSGNITVTPTNTCGNGTAATLPITITPSVTPSVSVAATQTTICAGTNVTFTATPSNGGSTPTYQWKLNNNNVGTNSTSYSNASLANNDVVTVVMTSNATCATSSTATASNTTITVTTVVVPSVSIVSSKDTICAGASVTYTATPVNGGTTPAYAWKVNGNPAGTNSSTFTSSALANGDVITVVLTTNAACASPTTATSNSKTITVNAIQTTSVVASADANNVCAGTNVTFTATPTNGGTAPSYQWKLNNNNVGTNSATYSNSSLANSDVVKVVMTSSLTCVNSATATSNSVTMTINPLLTPSVAIGVNDSTVCAGTNVIFTATPTNGGTPSYAWKLNGNPTGSNAATYSSTTLSDNDVVSVIMTSTATCKTTSTATSNAIKVAVNPILNVSVSIAESQNNICSGTSVTFTATPSNEGTTPTYVWKLNSNTVGGNSNTFSSSSLNNNDVVSVQLTSSEACVNTATVNSNSITMLVTNSLIPSVNITATATTICNGDYVKFTASPVNGGNASYQWKLNGNNVGADSDTLSSTSLANGDVISVVLTSDATCVSPSTATSKNMSITVNTVPNQPSAITGNSNLCAGATGEVYSVTSVPNVTYKWSFTGGGGLISETSNTLTKNFPVATSGYLDVSAENSCGRSAPSQLLINVNSAATQPGYFTDSSDVVDQGQTGVLYSVPNTAGVTYTWSFDGGPITVTTNGQNAVSIDFDATDVSGTLSVVASNGCGTSVARTMPVAVNITTGIDENHKNNIGVVYPNPYFAEANVLLQTTKDQNVTIKLVDVQGKEIFTILPSTTLNAGTHNFALPSNLPSAVYFVTIRTEDGAQNIKVVKVD